MSRSSANLTGQAVILVIMYVEIFGKSDRTSCDTSDNVCREIFSKSDRTSCDTSDNVCRDLQQNLTRQAVILVIMYVEIFSKSDRTSCDTSDNVCRDLQQV